MAQTPRFSRVLNVLDFVARAEKPARIVDLVENCGVPKATVHRLCRLLREEGFLQEELGGKGLLPGPKLGRLAQSVLSNQAFNAGRHAILTSVARRIGETCNIAIPDGTSMRYFDRVETEWPLKAQLPVGTRVPLHCTASGKMYLSSLPPARRHRLLEHLDLAALTRNSITDPGRLEENLKQIAVDGVGTDDEEFIAGMIGVSVPVLGGGDRLFAVLSFHAPVARMSLDDARKYADVLRDAARELADDMANADEVAN